MYESLLVLYISLRYILAVLLTESKSFSKLPGAILGNWLASPTKIIFTLGINASIKLLNKNISTMLDSSTIISFVSLGLNLLTLNSLVSLFHFKNLCIVLDFLPTLSVILLAALPVGASKVMSLTVTCGFIFS